MTEGPSTPVVHAASLPGAVDDSFVPGSVNAAPGNDRRLSLYTRLPVAYVASKLI